MKTNIIIKFIMAVAKLSGIKPKDLAEVIKNGGTRKYAADLYRELGSDPEKNYRYNIEPLK